LRNVAHQAVIAQLVMVVAALYAYRLIRWRGHWWVILITFLALPLRGLVAASVIRQWGVWPVQVLDGIGAGLQSVAVPALVVRLLEGTGRVNAGQGIVMTVQGGGAALSPALAGILAHRFGYPMAFITLGAISTGSLLLWLGFGTSLRHVCRPRADSTTVAAHPGAP
jgi:MFS family permease